jgi:hypothetical protein
LIVWPLRRAEQRHDAKRTEVRDRIGQKIEQHSGLAG